MPHYRRLNISGGTFFFTVTLADRSSDLLVRHIDRLRIHRRPRLSRPWQYVGL
jgi:putative transposase